MSRFKLIIATIAAAALAAPAAHAGVYDNAPASSKTWGTKVWSAKGWSVPGSTKTWGLPQTTKPVTRSSGLKGW